MNDAERGKRSHDMSNFSIGQIIQLSGGEEFVVRITQIDELNCTITAEIIKVGKRWERRLQVGHEIVFDPQESSGSASSWAVRGTVEWLMLSITPTGEVQFSQVV